MTAIPYKKLEATIGYHFKDASILVLALMHSSTNRRQKNGQSMDNERLEFLGDRVLGLVIADILFQRYPSDKEGDLARRHTGLVRREALAQVARDIDLGAYIDMIPAEAAAGGRDNEAILSNACEAVLAALYLDGQYQAAYDFVAKHWEPLMTQAPTPPQDNKTALQEWAQGRKYPLPAYEIVRRDGPPHAPIFEIEVRVQDQDPQRAVGPSKRKAEQAAAGLLLSLVSGQKNT